MGGAVRYRIERHELGLHIGGKTGVRRGANIDRTRAAPFHIELYPAIAQRDFGSSLLELGQYRLKDIGPGVAYPYPTTRQGRSDQEGPGFDAVGHDVMVSPMQAFDAL